MVSVVGIGPGSEVFISPAAWECVRAADLLIGSSRALQPFAQLGKEAIVVAGDITAVVDEVERLHHQRRIAVLVSGHPGLFSLLEPLRRRLGRDRLTVIPGVGAAQLLFARLALSWDGVTFISLHGQENGRSLNEPARAGRAICIYTDRSWSPPRIAGLLLAVGVEPERRAVVGVDLSYDSERIVDTTVAGLKDCNGDGLHIVYVEGKSSG